MALYTNEGLVKHCEKALKLKTKYMWGGILRPIEKQYDTLKKIYGNTFGTGYNTARWNELAALKNQDVYAVDCIGLVKSYYWSGKPDGGVGSPYYPTKTNRSAPDISATDMFNISKVKGKISEMPEIPGLIVYSKSHPHVGVYIGNGYTIESTYGSRGDGVVKRKLDSLWEYWFECPYIEYIESEERKQQAVTLAYDATIRDRPLASGRKLGRLTAKTKCVIVRGTETKDPKTNYIYVRLAGGKEQWIVKSAIKQ